LEYENMIEFVRVIKKRQVKFRSSSN